MATFALDVAPGPATAAPGTGGGVAEGSAQARQQQLLTAGVLGVRWVDSAPFGPTGVERWRLDNGLEILLARDPLSPVVAVHTWITLGSADEVPGKTGLAHLLEHAMFKSTTTRPAGTLDRLLEQHGASANAATWLDWTMYHEVVPADQLDLVLGLEADRFAHLDLSAAAVRSELEVVRNERREAVDDDPDGQVDEALWTAAFGGHPYGHPVIGTSNDLSTMTVADVVQAYRAHYSPARAAVILAGRFDSVAALTTFAREYGAQKAQGTAVRVSPQKKEPAIKATDLALQVDAGASRLAVAWRTVALDRSDHPALALLAEVLAGSDGARLPRRLVDGARVASHVSADQTDLRLGGLLEVRATLRPSHSASEALSLVQAEVDALLGDRPVTEDELRIAKIRLRTQQLRELATVDGRADVLGHAWATAGTLSAHARWWQSLDATSLGDVQKAAETWLRPDRRTVIRADPPPPKTTRARAKRGRG